MRDILKGEDAQIAAVTATLAQVSPDIVLLTGIDWDYDLHALHALNDALGAQGAGYDHLFARRPNSGRPSGLDLDGDGRTGGPGDALGYGRFSGHGGIAVLSRWPLDKDGLRDFTGLMWRDLPGARMPEQDGQPFPSLEAWQALPLSSVAHWDLPVILPGGDRLHLLTLAANTPVFDGPEDRNGKRNHDEIMLWRLYLDGELAQAPPDAPVVVLGNANLDPVDGEGLHGAIAGLLSNPRLRDPAPRSDGGVLAAKHQGGANVDQLGDPALDTADWRDEGGPGNLRVSYVLPDARLPVTGAAVVWPMPGDALAPLFAGETAPRHRLVWVDIELPE